MLSGSGEEAVYVVGHDCSHARPERAVHVFRGQLLGLLIQKFRMATQRLEEVREECVVMGEDKDE